MLKQLALLLIVFGFAKGRQLSVTTHGLLIAIGINLFAMFCTCIIVQYYYHYCCLFVVVVMFST